MKTLIALFLWCLLLLFCWPLALLVVVLFPLVWLLCLPFRLADWILEGALSLIRGLLLLPGRGLGGARHASP